MAKTSKIKKSTEVIIDTFASLGREIKISPKSKVNINKSGFRQEWFVPTADILIGIGKNHTATLIMDVDALKALQAGEPIDVGTLKEFKKQIK